MAIGSKRKAVVAGCCLSIFLIIVFNNQSPKISDADKKYLDAFLKEWKIEVTPEQVHQSADNELAFISRIQDSVISQIQHTEIPHQAFGDVSNYFINRKGMCYDRAVLLEKFFSYYQFPFRHIYVYFGRNGEKPSFFDFFKRRLSSHALLEVKTGKGWLTVGTNANWMGVSKGGQLLTIADIRKEAISAHLDLKKPGGTIGITPFWKSGDDFRFVYGVYSRHGDFFNHSSRNVSLSSIVPGFHILPDYNLKMFLCNFSR